MSLHIPHHQSPPRPQQYHHVRTGSPAVAPLLQQDSTPEPSPSRLSPAAGDSVATGSDTQEGSTPAKPKQKRNKPTLSCHECVERKTKVRPTANATSFFAT